MAKLPTLQNPFADAILGNFCADQNLAEAIRGAHWEEEEGCLILNLRSISMEPEELREAAEERLRMMAEEALLPEEDQTTMGPEDPIPFKCAGMVVEYNGKEHLLLKLFAENGRNGGGEERGRSDQQ